MYWVSGLGAHCSFLARFHHSGAAVVATISRIVGGGKRELSAWLAHYIVLTKDVKAPLSRILQQRFRLGVIPPGKSSRKQDP